VTARIPLYCVRTATHEPLYREWFAPSLERIGGFELRPAYCDTTPGGRYREPSWSRAILAKSEVILGAIRDCPDRPFVYSDVDVQFFRPAARALLSALEDGGGRGGERADERGKERGEGPRMHDIVCQADDREGLLCTGFFVARGTDALRGLWQCVRDRAIVDGRDQLAFNELVREDARSARRRTVRAGTLPREFFGAGCGLRQPEGYDSERRFHLWEPGVELDVPEDVVVHHANWTVGVDRKLAQLELVAECVRARSANA